MTDLAHEMAMRLNTAASRVKSVAGNWMCTCPAHKDRNPSLGIKYVNQRLVYRCFAGCSFRDIAAQIRCLGYDPTNGEPVRDRDGRQVEARPMRPVEAALPADDEKERRFLRDFEYDPRANPGWLQDPRAFEEDRKDARTTRYVYRDAFGHPMMTVTRLDGVDADGRKHKEIIAISPWRQKASGRVMFPRRTMPAPRTPYGLERTQLSGPVFSVEGEKCADRLFTLLEGKFAVFSVYGSSPEKANLEMLQDRLVINLSDIDKGGRHYRERLGAALGGKLIHVSSPWRGAAGTRPPKGWDIADEIDGKDGLVEPITAREFVEHVARHQRQVVRPEHNELLKEAVKQLRRGFRQDGPAAAA